MIPQDLKNWPIFNLLEPQFISKLYMVFVYDDAGHAALIVTKDRMVYTIGGNNSISTPIIIESLCQQGIKTFAHCCNSKVLILTEKGEVYSCATVETPNFIKINIFKQFVVDIACESHFALALTDNGKYRHGKTTMEVYPISNTLDVVCIVRGASWSTVVTKNGDVYGMGENSNGQLGIGNAVAQTELCKVRNLDGVVIEKVVCGSAHCLALSTKGDLYAWGKNKFGQLGCGDKADCFTPVKLKVQKVMDIAAFRCISAAIGEDNRVFVWGQYLGQSITIPLSSSLKCLHDAFAPGGMHKPLILHNKDNEMSITDHLIGAFDDADTSDLTIQVQGKPIHVHKAILKIRCEHFRIMFKEHWAENNKNVIKHDQFSYDVYKAFLKYLYTDEIDVPLKNALELLDLADAYLENQLKKYCIDIIKEGISIENVVDLYNRAIIGNFKKLEEYCFEFALNHMTTVVQTPDFAKLDEFTVKAFIIKAAQANIFKT